MLWRYLSIFVFLITMIDAVKFTILFILCDQWLCFITHCTRAFFVECFSSSPLINSLAFSSEDIHSFFKLPQCLLGQNFYKRISSYVYISLSLGRQSFWQNMDSKFNKADRHKWRAPSIQRRTNRPTNRQTDRPTYRPTEWLIESHARD